MLDAFLSAAAQLLNPVVLGAMLLALPLGVVIGLLPGLSGITALAFLIPWWGVHSCLPPMPRCRRAAR
jgi:TctA family transporter